MAMAIDEKSLPKLREYLATRNFTDKYFQLSQLINKFDSVADIKVYFRLIGCLINPPAKPFCFEESL